MFLLIILNILIFFPFSYSGSLKPSSISPIIQEICNKNENSNYIFTFSAETTISPQSTIEIEFPPQYELGLGMTSEIVCSMKCKLTGLLVTFFVEETILAGIATKLTIYNVLNPSVSGGTANFILRSRSFSLLVDCNLIFGVLGISSSIPLLLSPSISLSSSSAGVPTKYSFSFKTPVAIPSSSIILLILPSSSSFQLSTSPSCSSFPINGYQISGSLSCVSENLQIIIKGLTAEIKANSDVGVGVSIGNPPVAGTTGEFSMAVVKEGTKVFIAWRKGVKGVTIGPGEINKVSLKKIDDTIIAAKSKIMDYRLSFIPKNPLPLGSFISIQFPDAMPLEITSAPLCYLEYGVEDISESSPAKIDVVSNKLIKISNYKNMTIPGEIGIKVRLVNPADTGVTSPVKIVTYLDDTLKIIDQDITTATVTIENVASGTDVFKAVTITAGNALADNSIISLRFSLNPTITIPAGGYIKILVPSEFVIGTVSISDCILNGVASKVCFKKDQLITIQLNPGIIFNIGTAWNFEINNVIRKPVYEGTFLFDITSYSGDGTSLLDSLTSYLIITPNVLIVGDGELIGGEPNKASILKINFQTILEIPDSIPITSSSDIQGIIQLDFSTGSWANDFSSNEILQCVPIFGILPLENYELQCQISSPKTIQITRFKMIPSGTVCRLFIAKLTIPAASTSFTLQLIKKQNRLNTILNVLVINPGTKADLATMTGVTSAVKTFSQNRISSIFDLEFETLLTTTLDPTHYLVVELPTYDVGFIPTEKTITCFLITGSSNPVETYCVPFKGLDWVLLKVGGTFAPHSKIQIKNLKWPRYSYNSAQPLLIRLIQNGQEIERKSLSTFPKPSHNTFELAEMNVPKKGKGFPDCSYYFTFKTSDLLPDQSQVILQFPQGFYLQGSYPSPTFSAPQFKSLTSLSFNPSLNVLTISNIASFPSSSIFTLSITGIKNPSLFSSTFLISSFSSSSLINQSPDFATFTLGDSYTAGTIIFNGISAFPQNAGAKAIYYIDFTPSGRCPTLAIIKIKFPSAQYPNVVGGEIRVEGGVKIGKYSSVANEIEIVTGSVYQTGQVRVVVEGVENPEKGVTDGFEITISYDNVFLDQTDTSDLSFRTVEILEKANPLTVNSIDFEPRNEGEKAKYIFSLTPSSAITKKMQLLIEFPQAYDNLIGSAVSCVGLNGVVGGLDVKVDRRRIFISGLDDYAPSFEEPMIIEVRNVVNPNRVTNNGVFRIATLIINSDVFVDYNENAGTVEIMAAASWIKLIGIESSNYYSRIPANYTINLTVSNYLPNNGSEGYLLLDFPSDFDLQDKPLSCNASVNFAPKVECFSLRNRVYAKGNPLPFIGDVSLIIYNLQNPILEGSIQDITVMTYDGFNKRILERSYPNLDPFYSSYSYLGPLITVNSDEEIIVEKGTQTIDLKITMDYPCALNLYFKGTTDGFKIIPELVPMYLGSVSATFRVSVPSDFSEGTYYIFWVTIGDQDPPIYTPLKKSKVTITNLKNVRIELTNDIFNIPYGGSSLPIEFSTKYAPHIGIELILSLASNYPGVSLTQKNLIFQAGFNRQSFEIVHNNQTNQSFSVNQASFSLILTGVNKDTYALNAYSYDFVFMYGSWSEPTLTELTLSSVGQISCLINIGANEPAIAYYMIALKGTDIPSLNEVSNGGPSPYNSTLSQYGSLILGGIYRKVLEIKGLKAEISYTIFVYLKNRGGILGKVKTLDFTTSNRYNAADVSLKFLQAYLNSAEKLNIIKGIAFVLSLPPEKIQEKKYFFYSKRELAVEEVATMLYLQISTVDNSTDYPSPLKMAELLRNKTKQLSSLLTNFDSTYYIQASEFQRYIPTFAENPNITDIGQYSCSIQAKLNNYGFVYAIAVNASEDKSKPSSYQISQGYDSHNILIANGKVEISQSYTYFSFDIKKLTPNTQYNVYISAGSAHPGHPDLINDKSVILIGIQTKPLIIYDPLDINEGKVNTVLFFYLVLILILIF